MATDGSSTSREPSSSGHVVSDVAFIGYLAPDGRFETYSEAEAEAVDFHHTFLIKDLDAYHAEGGLTFVRNGGKPVLSIRGTPAMDPYEPASSVMVAQLAHRVLCAGAASNMPMEIEDMGFTRLEAPYQGKRIGTVGEWAERCPDAGALDRCEPYGVVMDVESAADPAPRPQGLGVRW